MMNNADDDNFDGARLWDLPTVDDQQAVLDSQTNALNRPRTKWQYEAPEQDEEVKPLTAKEIEAIRTAAYQEGLLSGHEEGFNKGQQEGFEQGKQEGIDTGQREGLESASAEAKVNIDEQLATLASVIENIQKPLTKINDQVKNELVLLSVSLAKAIIKTEIEHNSHVLFNAITQGIKTLPIGESQYQLALHPEDKTLVIEHFGEQTIQDNQWVLIEDSTMTQGGCKIQTNTNAVDVSIERRSEQVFAELLLNQGLVDDPRAS